MTFWLQLAVALMVFFHGVIYVAVGSTLPGPITAWKGESWLLGGLVGSDRLTALAIALHVTAGVMLIGAAVAIGFAPALPGWWRVLAAIGGVVGVAAFGVFWDGQIAELFEEGVGGAVISLVLVTAAVALPVTP